MKIIIGLGNIGEKYEKTRHNAGFLALDKLSEQYESDKNNKWKTNTKLEASIKEINILGEKTLLVKPTTFMNLSGVALQKVINFYKEDLSNLIVIFDDIDLPLGEIRYREKGSAGTHNGVKSIITHLNTDTFHRIKIGIENRTDDLKKKYPLSDYVLAKFTNEELKVINESLEKAIEIIVEKFQK